jgi:hypothetical protein
MKVQNITRQDILTVALVAFIVVGCMLGSFKVTNFGLKKYKAVRKERLVQEKNQIEAERQKRRMEERQAGKELADRKSSRPAPAPSGNATQPVYNSMGEIVYYQVPTTDATWERIKKGYRDGDKLRGAVPATVTEVE